MSFLKFLKKRLKEIYFENKYHLTIELLIFILLVTIVIFTPELRVNGFLAILFGIFLGLLKYYFEEIKYNKSIYKKINKVSYLDVLFNVCKTSEYLTSEILEKQPELKKVLVNLYIPKENGETTEIDAIMINKYGIFVIESKGFSGWIFGNEKSDKWMQIIFRSRNRFYNPVIQNRNHILALANLLNIQDMNAFKSYIVFSERCVLKRIDITNKNIKVIKRDKLKLTLQDEYKDSQVYFTDKEINDISEKLFQYMNVNDSIKIKHKRDVENIKNYYD
jgi:hypothetical protein